MIGCYVTGILPRSEELIQVTRDYVRSEVNELELQEAFEYATSKTVSTQMSSGFSYITDGMLKWQDLLRPLTTGLDGVKTGSLARWFNNNTFYRKPIIVDEISRKKNIIAEATYINHLPTNVPWKAIIPAPYTFTQLSENKFYKNKTELMFKYAAVLKEEIARLAKLGFRYIQLSDPALVYEPISGSISKDDLNNISEALRTSTDRIHVKTCLQTFFGDFSRLLPEVIDFPIDHFGIDILETNIEELREYSLQKGVALGLINSRNSLIEKPDELISIAKEIVDSICPSKSEEIFVCPNCDLDFLTWEKAQEKMRVMNIVASRLREEFS